MKRILLMLVLFAGLVSFSGCFCAKTDKLPAPEIDTSTLMGEAFGLDKNISVAHNTLDKYLFRDDVVYRDMRMLEDPATYEALADGDRFLSGFVQGFEVVPYPYLAPVEGLPSEVQNAYSGPSLFRHENGQYIANYKESMDVLEDLFPKDKVIFLMCGGGGYAGSTRSMLISLGWDVNKLYNVGGYWYYNGNHSIQVKREVAENTYKYDFHKVNYHYIDFNQYTLA